jgi:diaminobutyrate-2-oxoglutarate transaminase
MDVNANGSQETSVLPDDEQKIFVTLESEVRRYCRSFPEVFITAQGAHMVATNGARYIDFFCGAGALNYGHNNSQIKGRLLDYIQQDGLMHALDMYTTAKSQFLTRFRDVILQPRDLPYKVQFCGPSGSDAVEAALKLARKATGRSGIVAFAGAYHGMTLGSLSATGGSAARRSAGVPLSGTTFLPYAAGPWGDFDAIDLLRRMFLDSASGVDIPAAVIVEPLQMEGGIYPAPAPWLRRLREVTSEYGVPLILDEIQAGCGRTGTFFCFEQAGIRPDMVTLSKSISGYGYPMSVLLMAPELDVWAPGEHSGTFRGNQLAFVTGAAALDFWEDPEFLARLDELGRRLQEFGQSLTAADSQVPTRGAGMVLGIDFGRAGGTSRAAAVQRECFDNGLIVEVCGRDDEVLKLMPPLNVDDDTLKAGFEIVRVATLGTESVTS